MFFTPLLLAALSVQVIPSQAYDYSTLKLCTTKYGSKSTAVKTTSYAVTIPITIDTTTQTITVEATTFTSTTTSIATSTVPTAAGFTPLASGAGYVAKRSIEHAEVPAIRGRPVEQRAAPQKPICPPIGKPGSFSQFPQSVVCGALVVAKTTSTKTFTATTKATTTLPVSTSTITSSISVTETSISAAAPASTTTTTTLSFSTTETATSTATNTATQTVTIVEASSTVYAACAANNLVNRANGNQGIITVFSNTPGFPTVNEVSVPNPLACCEQCQKTSGCLGFAQFPGQARCFYFTGGQCNASQFSGASYQSGAGLAPSDGYTIGNGQCGQLGNGGSGSF
ncbi:MAG: hypothetical protein Q9169_007450 [Polycauliona sp. 2 TL-2023]